MTKQDINKKILEKLENIERIESERKLSEEKMTKELLKLFEKQAKKMNKESSLDETIKLIKMRNMINNNPQTISVSPGTMILGRILFGKFND